LKKSGLKPKTFLFLLLLFSVVSVYIVNRITVKQYSVISSIQQSYENLEPQLREENISNATNNGVCGTPVTLYEGTDNCDGGGGINIDFSQRNGGRRSGVQVTKDTKIKISKIVFPVEILSGTDIPNTNLTFKKSEISLPSSSAIVSNRLQTVGNYPGQSNVEGALYETWGTVAEVKSEGEVTNKVTAVFNKYIQNNTRACAECSTNSDQSEKTAEVVNDRSSIPGHSTNQELETVILMCKDENSISVDAKEISCIDEEFSIVKRITAIFSSSDWEDCNKVEYDEDGNIISTGQCIDIENVVLDLSGIFEQSNEMYGRAVSSAMYPGRNYNEEVIHTFPAWIDVDGKGIFKVSAKMNVPYEAWRMYNSYDDIESETPSSNALKAYLKWIEGLNRDSVSF
jgi:hypothetical protein